MKAYDYIKFTRLYLDYLERHISNIERAYYETISINKDIPIFKNEQFLNKLETAIKYHDVSKFSEEEFVQYRKTFYSMTSEESEENRDNFDKAWKHYWENNDHHIEHINKYLANRDVYDLRYCDENEVAVYVSLVHMYIDWVAMAFAMDGTAQQYYEKETTPKLFNDTHEEFLYMLFDNERKCT